MLLLCVISLYLSACGPSPSNGQVQSTGSSGSRLATPRLTYVAIGASDTFGIGTDDPQTESWPSDLAAKLGNGVHLVNLGIPEVHVDNALNVELPVALDSHADLITVWLAVNDLADDVPLDIYTRNLDLLLTRLQAAPSHVRIAVANVPDLTYIPRFQSSNRQTLHTQIASYNATIAALVQHHHVLLVDLYARWHQLAEHPEYISNDGFHPSILGYSIIAGIFYDALQEKA